MECPSCSRENRDGARFCRGCGKPLVSRCSTCGAENEPGAQFCDACGTSLVRHPAGDQAVARKVVTIVFADLIGSTALHERLDAESARTVMDRYYRTMHAAVEAHGGTVVKLLGDGVMAAFGVPRVAEDDAIRAVRAALAMQSAFRELTHEQNETVGAIGLRVAVNSGEVVVSDDNADVVGDPVNVAARLQQEARDGEVLIGEATRRLVADLVTLSPFGTVSLKGRSESVAAYRVVSLERPTGASTIAFVGRDDELRRITAVYDMAVAQRAARLAVILGSPGLGKSRVITEITRRLGEYATVLAAHCDAAGGATFAPLADALRAFLRAPADGSGGDLRAAIDATLAGDDSDRTRIADGVSALLAGAPASPEETFFVVRRLLAALARTAPVVLTIDDIQWAEPLLLDLVEHLVQWGAGTQLFLLTAARPELRDTRSSLAQPGALVTDVVTLTGLDASAATRLAANVIGADELPAALAGRVLATSEGNPLFLAELVRMLVDDGALKREGSRWIAGAELAAIEMPPTIHALLAARIERLRPEERTVLERAAIIGRHFSRAAVAHLLPRESAADLDARIESLRRSELVEPDTGWYLGEPALRFHHVLIRDAAYRRVLKGTRAELHARLADWVESRAGTAGEHDETVGWHLEQAHQHLRELGPIDEQGRILGERAARRLAAAGRRALARDDLPVAASILGRALDRLDPEDAARADLALDWCEALLAAGDVGPAARAVDELGRFAGNSDRLRAWHACFAGELAVLTDPEALRATADAVAEAADTLTAANDATGEAKAHFVHAAALARLGKIGAAEAALDRALAAARHAHDRRRANAVLAGAPLAALWGPSPVTRASGRCLDVVRVLRITQGAPAVEAVALRCQAVLEALRGRAEAARRMIASSRKLVEELGITQRILEADVFAGLIDLLEGDAATAERNLRSAYDGFRTQGLRIDAAQAGALLGRALLAQDRAAEAEAVSRESEELAGDDLKAAIAWRGVRAEALARRGEHGPAVELARAAVDIAATTDALLDHADARLALATALRAAGRSAEADAEETRAMDLWEAKGATLLVEKARRGGASAAADTRVAGGHDGTTSATRRRVRPNAATAYAARLDAAVNARDADALGALYGGQQLVSHTIGVTLNTTDMLVDAFETAIDLSFRHVPIATLGDSLALLWFSQSVTGYTDDGVDVGAVEMEFVAFREANVVSGYRGHEIFAVNHLADAIIRLYSRYAELQPEGLARERAAATARAVALLLGPVAGDALGAILAPAVEFVDHQRLGFPALSGPEMLLEGFRTLFDTAENSVLRVDDILDLRASELVLRTTVSGTDRVSGGLFERQFISLWVFDGDKLARIEWFDADRDDEALARLDVITGEAPVVQRRVRANAATANSDRMEAAVIARDADALRRVYADDSMTDHHPTEVTYDLRGALGFFRSIFDAENLTYRHESLATLGDSLALIRGSMAFTQLADSDVGAVDDDRIAIVEVDHDGRRIHTEIFAVDHLGDAVTRLYERYAELLPDGPERERATATARCVVTALGPLDLERYATALSPAVEFVDRRRLGFGTARGIRAYLAGLGSLVEMTIDTRNRVDDVLALSHDAFLERFTNFGTDRTSGGSYERQMLIIWCFGPDGLVVRTEQFDVDDLTIALARFDELTSASPLASRIVNAATRSAERFREAWVARDWERVAAVFAPGFRLADRRALVLLDLDRDEHLAATRRAFEMRSSRFIYEVLATRGDRLSLARQRFESSGDVIGPTETDWLSILEVDDNGDRISGGLFDPKDLDAAYAELDARYEAGEGAPYAELLANFRAYRETSAVRDWEALARLLPDDFTMMNHRRFAGTGARMNRDEYIAWRGRLDDLSVSSDIRVDHVLRISPRTGVHVVTSHGTTVGGGAFVLPSVNVYTHDGHRFHSFEAFDLENLDAALARYDELARQLADGGGTTGEQDPLARFEKPNAATRAIDRAQAACDACDWVALRAVCADDAKVEDRRRHALISGDADWWVTDLRTTAEALDGARWDRRLVATAGDRLALERILWTGRASGGPIEIEYLRLAEVDEQGRVSAVVGFDVDDRLAANQELAARRITVEPAIAAALGPLQEFIDGSNTHDRPRVRAVLADDVVTHDRRRTGVGRIEGAEAYLDARAAMWKLAPDIHLEASFEVAREHYGSVGVGRLAGTLPEGGAFETLIASVVIIAAGRVTQHETFEIEDVDAALARLKELRPDPLQIPPNAASRASDRWGELQNAGDWEALRALYAPGLVYEDRRRLIRISDGDVEMVVASSKEIARFATQHRPTSLASAGDRLLLQRFSFSGAVGGPEMELDALHVTEVDTDGRIVAAITFDPDDRRGAAVELRERFARSEDAQYFRPAGFELMRAVEDHDLERCRAAWPEGSVFHDRRRTGGGLLETVDQYIDWLAALFEQSPDATIEPLYFIALEKHGVLSVAHTRGTLASGGGEFESVFVQLVTYDGDRVHAEIFEVDDLEVARARFEALRPTDN